MARNDRDLFERLRRAGVRKQVARTLSGIGEGASKKAVGAARSTVSELRSVADEIERRLPSGSRSSAGSAKQDRRARPPATKPTSAAGSRPKTAAAAGRNDARAPRGQNKAMILASLKSGPKTASEISKETGIATGTVGSALSKMATAGEVRKADRGYALSR